MTLTFGLASGLVSGLVSGLNPSSGREFPSTSLEWAAAFPGITAPINLYSCADATAPLVDGIGSADLVAGATSPVFNQTGGDPLGRTHVGFDTVNTDSLVAASSTAVSLTTGDFSIWMRAKITTDATANKHVMGKRAATGGWIWLQSLSASGGGKFRFFFDNGSSTGLITSANANSGEWMDILLTRDVSATSISLSIDSEARVSQANARYGDTIANSAKYSIGELDVNGANGPLALHSYHAIFDYVVSESEWATLRGA